MSADLENGDMVLECRWRFVNFSLCPMEAFECYDSPVFVVGGIGWRLSFYPRGDTSEDYMSYYLYRTPADEGPERVRAQHEISILSANGHDFAFSKVKNWVFAKDTGYGSKRFAEREKVMNQRDLYLPGDVLTLKCRLRLSRTVETDAAMSVASYLCGQTPDNCTKDNKDFYAFVSSKITDMKPKLCLFPNRCSLLTHIGVEYRRFTWTVEKWSSWKSARKLRLPVTCPSQRSLPLLLKFYLDDEESVRVQVRVAKPKYDSVAMRCKVSVLDRNDYAFRRVSDEHLFQADAPDQVWYLPILCNICELQNEDLDLQKAVLSLRFEFSISSGFHQSRFEGSSYDPPTLPSDDRLSESFLRDDLRSIYTERKFCDMTLQVRGRIFDVHKAVIYARAPYLRPMLEEGNGVMVVHDVDPCTVDRVVKFFYTDVVDDYLTLEEIARVFSCAKLWRIEPLIKVCSSLLMRDLSEENALVVLQLANQHSHSTLKTAVMDYICARPRVMVKSQNWKDFENQHPQLALETYHCITRTLLGF